MRRFSTVEIAHWFLRPNTGLAVRELSAGDALPCIISGVPGEIEINVPGASLTLLADKAVFWQEQSALLVADVHFGKAAAFRAHSIAVPAGTTAHDLGRLSSLIKATGAKSLYILGDMWHAKEGLAPDTVERIASWRAEWKCLNVVLVVGNHDRKCGALPEAIHIRTVEEPYILGGISLSHEPVKAAGTYTLAGHIHPCVRLNGLGRQSHRLPCFWFGERIGVLPAFGSFTGCAMVSPKEGDEVVVVADSGLIRC